MILTIIILYLIGLGYAVGTYSEIREDPKNAYRAVRISIMLFIFAPLVLPVRFGITLSNGTSEEEDDIEEEE